MTAVYDRHTYDKEKREALDAWSRRVIGIVSELEVPKRLIESKERIRHYGSGDRGMADKIEPQILNRKNFQALAQLRADETATLAKNGKKMGAFYLGGLAIECALKACISKKTKRHEFPRDRKYVEKVYSHDLSELLKLAGLNTQLEEDSKNNPEFAAKRGVVKSWKVDSRYETSGLKGSDMDTAVNSSDGVLQWIKLHW